MYNRAGMDIPMSPSNAAMYGGAPGYHHAGGYPQNLYGGGHPQRPMPPHHGKWFINLEIFRYISLHAIRLLPTP